MQTRPDPEPFCILHFALCITRHERDSRPRDVYCVPAAHGVDLPNQIVERIVAAGEIELRRLHDEQWRGRVVKEEVLIGLVQLAQVILARLE